MSSDIQGDIESMFASMPADPSAGRGGGGGHSSGGFLDKLPPQDLGAEQSVLGGMLLSKDAIADVGEEVRGHDFYKPAHELIFDAIIDLYSRGEPADAITVADELSKRGDLQRAGGQAYLHDLIQSVPTAANAGFYAQIVAERAVLRRLVDAGTRIVQMGYAQGGGDVEEIVNAAQAEVYGVAEKRGGEDYVPLWNTLNETMAEIEVAAGRTDELIGVPTGFTELDELTHGLHPGQMIVLAARPAVGKALALDTPLPTPGGWTTMGAVQVGDELLDAAGRPTRVVAATEVMTDRPCYEVEFSDGTVIVADEQHQWLTDTRASRRSAQAARDQVNRSRNQRTFAAVRTTAEIAATLRTEAVERRLNHSVALSQPLQLPSADLLVSPYVLGAWLGDGSTDCAKITTADDEMVMLLEAEGLCHHDHGTLQAQLRTIGVLGSKHIPTQYLRASQEQREALLAGLLDTDGTVTNVGCVQLTTTSARLRDDYYELIVSLGYRCGVSQKRVKGRTEESSTAYTLSFSTDRDVFRLERKNLVHKERRTRSFQRRDSRFITDVRPTASVPVRCVEVDNDDHLYLAGRSMVPTHNSTLGMDIARAAAIHHKMATAVFSLEMSRTEITMRILSAEASIQLQSLRRGRMRDEEWKKLSRVMGKISDSPLYIDDSPNLALMEIRAKARRMKQQHNLRLIVIDYLQLMSSGKKVESRQQEVAEFSRALKLLAKELEVPVIAISQLNRGPEQRTDKRPAMSDLRESGCLTGDTRILRADTGAETTIGDLAASGERDISVWGLDDSLRYVRRTMIRAYPTGIRPVFRLTLASGKTVRATENHPFLRYEGWTQLGDLRTGDRIAVPRHVPAPRALTEWSDDEVVTSARDAARGLPLPEEVASLPKRQIARFVESVWATRGWVNPAKEEIVADVSASVASAMSRLLLRFGIQTQQKPKGDRVALSISGVDSQRRFLQEVGAGAAWSDESSALLDVVRVAASGVDSVDAEVWSDVEAAVTEVGVPERTLIASAAAPAPGVASYASEASREPLVRVAEVLDRGGLDLDAVNDVFWDSVVSIEPDGVEEVFDATVMGSHNFIADGIAVHNSIEQDADVVILLHRDRDPNSEREGEADVIVAKHRNGPTADIVLGFQGHFARFSNLERDSGF